MARDPIVPPRAAVRPHRLEAHGDLRIDDYYWLRERDSPDVDAYLRAENAYLDAVMAPTAAFERRLFEEIKGRIKPTDHSVPYRDGAYWYYHRYDAGSEYRIHCRRPARPGQPVPNVEAAAADEQVILDANRVAAGHAYCDIGALKVSRDGRLLAYAVDTVGRREYTIRIRDLETGTERDDVLADATGNLVWAADGRTLLYTRHDPVTLRAHRIFRHRLGTDPHDDPLVFEETDETFTCAVGVSRSKRFLLIGSFQTVTTEYRYLDASTPDGSFTTFLARERGHEYALDHFRDRFYIRTNDRARNFRLMETDDHRPGRASWRELIPHREDVLIEGFEMFRDHLVVEERHRGLARIHVHPWTSAPAPAGGGYDIAFDEPAYDVYLETNRDPDTAVLRFGYSSMTTPASVYDYDLATHERRLLKREAVLGDFDPSRYETMRWWATSPDGVEVPISIVRRRDLATGAPAPLLLYGYGSYGISMSPTFRSSRLSLIDRGFVFAIAHVRGGEELGRAWYDDGKLRKKKNTFTDFIACAEHLVDAGLTAPDRLYAMGGSAGGLLMGAVINLRPDLFHGVVAQVPFVDVLTTMLDESIPLTTGEYDEWGNPNDPGDYAYIRSYSPYDNVAAVTWPHLLVMTGLHDSQVQYWEPAKWVAKRRATVADDRRLLLKTNLDAGHSGTSGRYRRYRELALQYTFLLDLAGLAER